MRSRIRYIFSLAPSLVLKRGILVVMSQGHHLSHITHHRLLELFTYGALCAVVFVFLSLLFGWIALPVIDFAEALPVSYSNSDVSPTVESQEVNRRNQAEMLVPTLPDFSAQTLPAMPELLP